MRTNIHIEDTSSWSIPWNNRTHCGFEIILRLVYASTTAEHAGNLKWIVQSFMSLATDFSLCLWRFLGCRDCWFIWGILVILCEALGVWNVRCYPVEWDGARSGLLSVDSWLPVIGDISMLSHRSDCKSLDHLRRNIQSLTNWSILSSTLDTIFELKKKYFFNKTIWFSNSTCRLNWNSLLYRC